METKKTEKINILSGPCFSQEVAQNLPTAVTLASPDRLVFDDINKLFGNKNFRLYFSDDLIGCQLGGAVKNIYAIAAGITMGLNLGENAKSALISRSFAEILRLANFYDAKNETLFGYDQYNYLPKLFFIFLRFSLVLETHLRSDNDI